MSSATSMRERIARAISGAPFPSQASYRKADAVLDAMLEPTEEMKQTVRAAYNPSFQAIWPAICGDIFTAMIRAAKEGR